ncbi:imm11 family protein [Paenibacillus sinopodophylli]|uniref:imm11 family protein n=1 Tax=Paenibacillus sinopodophylli TaxID=1837342 RepID=UPI00110CFE9C|nr:DUF1629 domain-containing protein [Paenibacillus sinopodophylli]
MKIWWLDYHPAYDTVDLEDYEEAMAIRERISGIASLSQEWTSFKAVLDRKNKHADIVGQFGGALTVTRRAMEVLSELPDLPVEFLPLNCPDGDYFVMNVLNGLDAVDPSNSKEYRTGSGRLSRYDELALRQDVVQGHDLFRIRMHEGDTVIPNIYISDRLKAIVEANLEGYQLIEIWDSEFSWQEKEAKYNAMCKEVDNSLQLTFPFGKAIKFVQKNKGQLALSGKWALKAREDNEILLGSLNLDGTYAWINPAFYPPIILYMVWGVVEKPKKKFFIF